MTREISQITAAIKNLGLDSWLDLNGYIFYPKTMPLFHIKLDNIDIGCYSWIKDGTKYSRIVIVDKSKSPADLNKLGKELVRAVKDKWKRNVDFVVR